MFAQVFLVLSTLAAVSAEFCEDQTVPNIPTHCIGQPCFPSDIGMNSCMTYECIFNPTSQTYGYQVFGRCSDPYYGTCINIAQPIIPMGCENTCEGKEGNNLCYVNQCAGNKWITYAPCTTYVEPASTSAPSVNPKCALIRCAAGFKCDEVSGNCVSMTSAPTKKPTRKPTTKPTRKPTRAPTRKSTTAPTMNPKCALIRCMGGYKCDEKTGTCVPVATNLRN